MRQLHSEHNWCDMAPHIDDKLAALSSLGLHNMVRVKNAHLKFYYETPLYYQAGEGIGFELYKPPGVLINNMRIRNDRIPPSLYIHNRDKLTGLRELQKGFNIQLKSDLESNNPIQVKNTLIGLVDETIKTPTEGSIRGAVDTMDILFAEYLKNRSVIDTFLNVLDKDYTTATHSVNVMALTLRFGIFCGFEEDETKKLGLSALLHDVGKIKISGRLLKSSRKLSDSEFAVIKNHTVYGYDILKRCNMPEATCLSALNHHERTDGSGYPNGITDITEEAQIIGFIDCYEALTCNERPYRNAVSPYSALSHIKTELFRGNFNSRVYEKFVKSLG
jgi:HD-GYP domain-containing protein (c-di-GMP phosphodiesterase class II)